MKILLLIFLLLIATHSSSAQIIKPTPKPTAQPTPRPYLQPIRPQQTSVADSSCFSTDEIDIKTTKLPPGYAGNNLREIAKAINGRKQLTKDEFETTKQFIERMAAAKASPLVGNLLHTSNFAFSIGGEFKYDADTETWDVRLGSGRILTWSANCSVYRVFPEIIHISIDQIRGQNVTDLYWSTNVKQNIKAARQMKPSLRLLLIGNLIEKQSSSNYYFSKVPTVYLNLKEVWIYDQSTGEILHKEDAVGFALDPDNQALLDKANALYNSYDFDAAMTMLRRVLAAKPTSHEAYLLLGKIHRKKGDLEQAISSLKTSIFWNSNEIEAHITLGEIYLEKRDCLQAKNYSASALEIDKTNEQALILNRKVQDCRR
jgi:tetratricopeptide (TPR) repeat protein